MLIGFPKEADLLESRIAILPTTIKKYTSIGLKVGIESGLGEKLYISDQQFTENGAEIFANKKKLLLASDLVVRVKKSPKDDISLLKENAIHVSFLDPFNEPELIKHFAKKNISAISMELIPRTTIAQKMDAISSQANLAGYAAVVLAASRLYKAFPMMVTAAGTVEPSRVFIIGVGVAGLQAIATAKRMGARVEAFDTRKETEEQVKSLGAKFINIDLGETGQTKDGYAKALTDEQLAKQRQEVTKVCARSDLIITTAQVFGKRAPLLITKDMIKQMQPGTVIVDMAVASGGNVDGSVNGQEVIIGGVKIIGNSNLPGTIALHASQMYSNNIYHLIEHFWDKETSVFKDNQEDEIMRGCLLTSNNQIIHPQLKNK